MKTLESILIERGELDRICKGRTALKLWRSLNQDDDRRNILHPDIVARRLPSGKLRDPDVESFFLNGVRFIKANLGQGTSLSDKPGIFSGAKWNYVLIPEGTDIPNGLIITKDQVMEARGCRHYSISPNFTMRADQYLTLLDQLAFNAPIEFKEVKRG